MRRREIPARIRLRTNDRMPRSTVPTKENRVNKLHLDLAELRIESFATAATVRESGTAAGFITQGAQTCYDCTRFGCAPDTRIC